MFEGRGYRVMQEKLRELLAPFTEDDTDRDEVVIPEKRKYALSAQEWERARELEPKVEKSLAYARKLLEIERRAGEIDEEMMNWNTHEQWQTFLQEEDVEKIRQAREIFRIAVAFARDAQLNIRRTFLREGESVEEIDPVVLGERMFFEKEKRKPRGRIELVGGPGYFCITFAFQEDANAFLERKGADCSGTFDSRVRFKECGRAFTYRVVAVILEHVKNRENIQNHEIRHFYHQHVYRDLFSRVDKDDTPAIAAKDEVLALLNEKGSMGDIQQGIAQTRSGGHRSFSGEEKEREVLDRIENVLRFADEEGLLRDNHDEFVALLYSVPFAQIPEWIAACMWKEKRVQGKGRA